MAPPRHPPPPTEQQQAAAAAAAAVRLPDFHADSPQSWFTNLDSQFATANITQSLTKFHWAVAKLPFSLSPTIQPLADDPTAVADPYGTLKELLLESYASATSMHLQAGIQATIIYTSVQRYYLNSPLLNCTVLQLDPMFMLPV